MTSELRGMTAQELLSYRHEPYRQELIAGRLHEMEPTGFLHGSVTAHVGRLLDEHVRAHGLGVVVGAETGFVLARDPDTVRAPDAAFVRAERVPPSGLPETYWPGPPDLAVEVLSPNDRDAEVAAKTREWLAAGTLAVVILDPRRTIAALHRPGGRALILAADETLDLDLELPGFAVVVATLFG